jgi:malonate decarboxylase beta subunit
VIPQNQSFTELRARERASGVLDAGTFREILGPYDHVESPHLVVQGIIPQSDDGAVIGRGTIASYPAVVIAFDGAFQGGGIGEVSGAKAAAALKRALVDAESGIPIRVVMLLETGGIRLQEANLGLLAIADIHAAMVALRELVPVVGVIAGMVGCFGGMGIAAGLTSHLVMTPAGRLGLNGPEVIETEAGINELDSSDRGAVWGMIGGRQRVRTGLAETLVDDQLANVRSAVRRVYDEPYVHNFRSRRVTDGQAQINAVDPATRTTPSAVPHLGTVDKEAFR